MRSQPYRIRDRRWATLPNLFSLVRVLLLVPTLIALEREEVIGPLPGVALVACALGTDVLDGLLARWRGWVSDLGRVLDPLADKIYLGGLVLYLSLARDFPWWLVGFVLARDLFLIAAGALVARRHGVVFAANAWGKVSTVILSLLVLAYLVRWEAAFPWLIAATAATLTLSLYAYVRNALRFLRARAPQSA